MREDGPQKRKLSLIAGAFNHRVMLADSVRTDAYQQAIDAAVKPGMTVLDLGTGSGILAMMAARAGAQKVVAVDCDPIVNLARQIAQSNGFGPERIEFVHGDSRDLAMAGQFDLVITECMGNFFVSDEMALVIIDAKRFLKKDGFFIPQRVDLFVAPAFYPQLNDVDFWRQEHYGFSYEPALELVLNRAYVAQVAAELLLSEPVKLDCFRFDRMKQDVYGQVNMEVTRDLTMHGICGWFEAHLTDQVRLSTRPGAATTHWGQTIFPIMPHALKAGDDLSLTLGINHRGDQVGQIQWEGQITRDKKIVHTFSHDTARTLL
jgi:ubiquinone/menaquinone biosynthesis C-methylase UbiE